MQTKEPRNHMEDLDNLYDLAVGKSDITAALKIKNMQLKYKEETSISDVFSDEHIDRMIERIESMLQHHV